MKISLTTLLAIACILGATSRVATAQSLLYHLPGDSAGDDDKSRNVI